MNKIILILLFVAAPCFAKPSAEVIVASTLVLEAGGETDPQAMQAVMNVIQNRAHQNPNKFVSVVLKKWQFSCWNSHTVKGKPIEPLIAIAQKHPKYNDALGLVHKAMENQLADCTQGAVNYYSDLISPPWWAEKMKFTVKIGHHLFYK